MLPVEYFGVWMNFMPRPRTDWACVGMSLPSVRSWKAILGRYGVRGKEVGWVLIWVFTAFWKGVMLGLGQKP